MKEKLKQLLQEGQEKIRAARSEGELQEVKGLLLGKQGALTGLLKELPRLDVSLRPEMGKAVNQAKTQLTELLEAKREELKLKASEVDPDFDISVPGTMPLSGGLHPITQMCYENGVEIPPQTAGLLLAAILSDTLMFRSPTCTPLDEALAKRLAKIAGVDIDEFANEMFEAGEKLDGKTAEEVFLQDFKVFMCGDIRFGVAQGSYMTRKNLQAAQALLQPYLEEARNKQNVEDLYMLLTDVPKEESVVICTGRYAAEVLSNGFESRPAADGSWTLPGVVSRKKQFIPAMMSAYQEL